jgi:hypothetical protein
MGTTAGVGMSKHYKSGHIVTHWHFTGKKKGNTGKKANRGLTHKQRKMKRHAHINKYAVL